MSRNFTAICFAISGIICCILTNFQHKYNIQLSVFLIVGIFLLLVVRPFLLKFLNRMKEEKERENKAQKNVQSKKKIQNKKKKRKKK